MKKAIKKGKITMTITIGIACFALVSVMMMQFKIVNETDITSIESMQEAELKTELANWKSKYDDINQKYEDTVSKIEEYKNDEETNSESSKLLESELEQNNMLLGLTDVQGEGIIVTLKTGKDIKTPINSDDLLIIVNSLKFAGAEAISINGQRIVNTTDITYINNEFIKVNGQRVLEPYVIKAIGNQSYLETALKGTGGAVEQLETLGHIATIEKDNKIYIDKYNQEINTKYIE